MVRVAGRWVPGNEAGAVGKLERPSVLSEDLTPRKQIKGIEPC